ncbi:MAG: hypothetical protein ACK5MV_05215 [Aminipila sp.]
MSNIMEQLKSDVQDYTKDLQNVLNGINGMVAELRNVKNAVTSNITDINVRPSETLRAHLTHPSVNFEIDNTTTQDYNLLMMQCLTRGVIRLKFHFITDSGCRETVFVQSGDFKATREIANWQEAIIDVPSNPSNYIKIGVTAGGRGFTVGIPENTVRVYYDIVDIVNGSAVSAAIPCK